MNHVNWGNSSPSLLRLVGVSSSQLHSSVGIDDGLQLLFPWSSSSMVSSRTFVYSFKLKWSSSSDGNNLKSSSTLNQLSWVLLSTSDRRFVIWHGGGSKIGVCSRFKLKLTNSMRGICDNMLKTCWIRKKRKSFQSIFSDTLREDRELGQCHLASEMRGIPVIGDLRRPPLQLTSFQFSNLFCAKSSSLTELHFFFKSSGGPAWSIPQSLSTSTCGTLCDRNCVTKSEKEKYY